MRISEKFTPEAMLGAPRRSPAVPSRNGTLALYTVSTYNFVEGKLTKELKTLEIQTGRSEVLSSDENITEALWVPGRDTEVAYLQKKDKGHTELVVVDVERPDESRHVVFEFDAPVSGLKLKPLDDETLAFAAAGLVGPDGKLYNETTQEKKGSARIFDKPRVWVVRTCLPPHRCKSFLSHMLT